MKEKEILLKIDAHVITQKEFLESKRDKKHVGTMWPPLEAAKEFLKSSEADNIPADKQIELYHKIQEVIKKIGKAREEKNWKEADKLREKIKNMGFYIDDTGEGGKIKKLK